VTYTVSELADALDSWTHEEPRSYTNRLGETVNYTNTYVGWYGLDDYFEMDHPAFDLPGFGNVRAVEIDSGGEGHGENIHMIFAVQGPDDGEPRFFKKEGYYASFSGSTWDGDFYEVERSLELVTVYKKVKK